MASGTFANFATIKEMIPLYLITLCSPDAAARKHEPFLPEFGLQMNSCVSHEWFTSPVEPVAREITYRRDCLCKAGSETVVSSVYLQFTFGRDLRGRLEVSRPLFFRSTRWIVRFWNFRIFLIASFRVGNKRSERILSLIFYDWFISHRGKRLTESLWRTKFLTLHSGRYREFLRHILLKFIKNIAMKL